MFDTEMKYIIYNYRGHEIPLIFPPIMAHDEVRHHASVVAAGFCTIAADLSSRKGGVLVTCFGDSESLKKKGRPEDAGLIESYLNKRLEN